MPPWLKIPHCWLSLTLGGFAGVRTPEILRMDWQDINFADGHISVQKATKVTRWRPRNVEMVPAFRRHLEPWALKSGPIFPEGVSQLYALWNHLVRALGLKCVRQTACGTALRRITCRCTTTIKSSRS
jgi:integrase